MKLAKSFAFVLVAAAAAFTTQQAHAWGRQCATVFQGPDFSGYTMNIDEGDSIADLGAYYMGDGGTWDNRISSVIVAPGCHLTGYQYSNFGRDYNTGRFIGFQADFGGYYDGYHGGQNHVDLRYTPYNDKISSLTCSCY